MIYFGLLLLFSVALAVDQDSRDQLDILRRRPHGRFYCKAKCVASCLEMEPNLNTTLCSDYCRRFDDETICPDNDLTCWQNCGSTRKREPYQAHGPATVENIKADFEVVDGDTNPYTVRIEWDPVDDVKLYILEIFPIRSAFSRQEHVVQMMTTETSYLFQRPDLCETYMARLMAVSSFGLSVPRYRRLSAWTLSSDTNLNFNVEKIFNDNSGIRVLLSYEKPSTWHDGDVEFESSTVRAYDCRGNLSASVFMSTDPDENGFYWPMVEINDSANGVIDLWFPNEILQGKCLYSFKVTSLKTRCGALMDLEIDGDKNGADFELSCKVVQSALCTDLVPGKDNPVLGVTNDGALPRAPPSPWSSQTGISQQAPDQGSEDHSKLAIDPAPVDSIYDDTHKDNIKKPIESSDQDHSQITPPSPWSDKDPDDAELSLWEAFVLGIAQGAVGESFDQPGDAEFTTTTLPPAPLVPQSDSEEITDDEFEKAFVNSFGNGSSESETVQTMQPVLAKPSAEKPSTTKPSIMKPQITKETLDVYKEKEFFSSQVGMGVTMFIVITLLMAILIVALYVFGRTRGRPPYTVFTNV